VKFDYKEDVDCFSCDNPSHMTVLDWLINNGDPHLIEWHSTTRKWKPSKEIQAKKTAPMLYTHQQQLLPVLHSFDFHSQQGVINAFKEVNVSSGALPICYKTCIASILKPYPFHSLKHWYIQHIFGPNVPCPGNKEAIIQTLVNHIYSSFLMEAKIKSVSELTLST
jgi:hypothetical protein